MHIWTWPLLLALVALLSLSAACSAAPTPTPTPQPTPTPLPTPTPFMGQQTVQVPPGASGSVPLPARAASRVTLTVTNAAPMNVDVRDPAGNAVRSNPATTRWQVSFLAIAAGTYTMQVANTDTVARQSQVSWTVQAP